MKIKRLNIKASTKNPDNPSHGACRLFFPWFNNSPNDGDPGGSPSPKKSSEVRAVTPPVNINGSIVIVATIALGRTCLNIIVMLDTPNARAALTKSKFLALKNSALTTPTNDNQLNRSKIISSTQNPGTRMLDIIINMYN